MNIRTITGLVLIGGALVHNAWATVHNRKIIKTMRSAVLQLISQSDDFNVSIQGKKLLIDEHKYTQKEFHQKCKEYLITHFI